MRRFTGKFCDHVNRPEKGMVVTGDESRYVVGTEGEYVLWRKFPRWKKVQLTSLIDWRKWAQGSTLDNGGYSAKPVKLY